MSESRLNIELFKKIRDRIATVPESYDQQYWSRSAPESPCGTAACLAGETIICSAESVEAGIRELKALDPRDGPDDPVINPQGFDSLVPIEAAKRLGLGPEHHQIFWGGGKGWPTRFRSRFVKANDARARSKVAVAYLTHIIETGKVLE